MSIRRRYNQCFMDLFQVSEDVLPELEYQSIKAWDSVGHMNLISIIEEEFDIEMDIDDITEFSSFDKGKYIVSKYGVGLNE